MKCLVIVTLIFHRDIRLIVAQLIGSGFFTLVPFPTFQGREKDAKITVYKKTDETYMLKMKHSREFFSSVNKKFGTMPFTLRAMENETKAKMGVVECVTHKLVEPFQVLYEKEGKP